ncbi:hypothetical protein [Companilactobacillus kedongensis]|uniref:hypothetical protein n=1 Tax=Companilactobacillus kedongensis TaxID=2486004 RepID=UPI0013DD998E|nr:hypothetical protein [Companilactobacillus kedongensis]
MVAKYQDHIREADTFLPIMVIHLTSLNFLVMEPIVQVGFYFIDDCSTGGITRYFGR